MKMKILLIFIVAAGIGMMRCSDSGTEPENGPKISVSRTDMTLFGNPRWDRLFLTNKGAGELDWQIDEKPEWIDVSNSGGSGITATDTDTIYVIARFDILEYGIYTGEIKISSNGGNAFISLNLDYRAPVLHIDNQIINMDRHYRYSELTLTNEGGSELVWYVAKAPEWLEFDVDSGTIYNQPTLVPFRAKLHMLEYGEYTDVVVIKSNGGEYEINIYLTYEREVEVYAGIGAANIDLGDTYLMVEKIYGKPNKSGYVRPADTLFVHNVMYTDVGIEVKIKNNSPILFGNGKVGFIRMLDPYDGLTPEQIGLKNSSTDLINAYGQPIEKNGQEWYYDGITFIIKNDEIQEMIIKDPDF